MPLLAVEASLRETCYKKDLSGFMSVTLSKPSVSRSFLFFFFGGGGEWGRGSSIRYDDTLIVRGCAREKRFYRPMNSIRESCPFLFPDR